MRSSDKRRAIAAACLLLTAIASPTRATAQLQAKGFAADRFYPSAPGGGWFVMDALDMRGGLGGAAALTASYARNPLRVRASDGSQHLNVVSEQAIANFGFTATYDRFRLYLDLGMPLLIKGSSGTVGRYTFTGPEVDPGTDPDSLSDPRIGFDARLVGTASGPFRLGAGAQLFVPNIFNDTRDHYDTDGTYRRWDACSSRATSLDSRTRVTSASTFARSTTRLRRAARRGVRCSLAPPRGRRCLWAVTAPWRSSSAQRSTGRQPSSPSSDPTAPRSKVS